MSASSNHTVKAGALHRLVFENDVSGVSKFLNQSQDGTGFVKQIDQYGNTPLHLAVMLGHKECVQILLKHNHVVSLKNSSGWTPLQESISYGDRQTISSLFRALSKQNKSDMHKRRPAIKQALDSLGGDFSMEMQWDFQSWIPFVSKILPSDICQIYRSGSRIRLDSTLEDFSDMKWVRGDISFIVDFDTDGDPLMILMDNKSKVYQYMQQTTQDREASIEDEVDIAMSCDIVDVSMKTKESVIDRINSGWIFRREKTDKVGKFVADFYRLSGLKLQTRKRREHLSEEDIKKNKSLRQAFSSGENAEDLLQDSADYDENDRRKSLPPPDKSKMSWNEYLTGRPGCSPCLGRKMKEKVSHKMFDVVLGMSDDFPVKLENLLPILESLGPKAKLFSKLRDFVTMKLPPGFPVRIDVPIFPTVKATVNFPKFDFREDLSESLFRIPDDYKEDAEWFEKSAKEKQLALAKRNQA